MNCRWPALFVTFALVATSCKGGGSDSAATTEKSPSSNTTHDVAQLDVAGVVVTVPKGSG